MPARRRETAIMIDDAPRQPCVLSSRTTGRIANSSRAFSPQPATSSPGPQIRASRRNDTAGTANRTGVSATRCLRFATIHPHRWACCTDDPLPASTSQVLEMARSCDVLPPLTVKSGGLWSTSAAWTSSPIHPSSSTTIGWAEPVVGRQDFRGGGGPSQSAGSANKPQSH